jgi:BMFP domain-containing protein YqiC
MRVRYLQAFAPCWDLFFAFSISRREMPLVFVVWLRYQMSMTKETIENLAQRLADAVPEGLKTVRDDLEANFRSVLRAGMTKLDLVTREEFEVQEAVLARTREKLETLEEQVAKMEG